MMQENSVGKEADKVVRVIMTVMSCEPRASELDNGRAAVKRENVHLCVQTPPSPALMPTKSRPHNARGGPGVTCCHSISLRRGNHVLSQVALVVYPSHLNIDIDIRYTF